MSTETPAGRLSIEIIKEVQRLQADLELRKALRSKRLIRRPKGLFR